MKILRLTIVRARQCAERRDFLDAAYFLDRLPGTVARVHMPDMALPPANGGLFRGSKRRLRTCRSAGSWETRSQVS